ncbi:MAG TPA: ribonuclease HI family protein [Desulfotomaculum sp.]|nr:ribonuclease HI family protein [Desulfotomaculum sp.]
MSYRATRYFVNVDGASRGNPGPAAAAMVVQDESGKVLLTKSKSLGITTNNVAEWSALEGAIKTLGYLAGRSRGKIEAVIRSDSELIVKQFNGEFRIRDPELKAIAARVRKYLKDHPALKISVVHVPREENRLADQEANKALAKEIQETNICEGGSHQDERKNRSRP